MPACPKCGSTELIPDARVVDHVNRVDRGSLRVEVYEDPDALVFKGTRLGTLTATICGRCGFTELYAANPPELLRATRRSRD